MLSLSDLRLSDICAKISSRLTQNTLSQVEISILLGFEEKILLAGCGLRLNGSIDTFVISTIAKRIIPMTVSV